MVENVLHKVMERSFVAAQMVLRESAVKQPQVSKKKSENHSRNILML